MLLQTLHLSTPPPAAGKNKLGTFAQNALAPKEGKRDRAGLINLLLLSRKDLQPPSQLRREMFACVDVHKRRLLFSLFFRDGADAKKKKTFSSSVRSRAIRHQGSKLEKIYKEKRGGGAIRKSAFAIFFSFLGKGGCLTIIVICDSRVKQRNIFRILIWVKNFKRSFISTNMIWYSRSCMKPRLLLPNLGLFPPSPR